MALPNSWKQLINRVQRHVNDNFPSSDWNVSPNEILLYIQEALAFALVGSVYQMAKVEGNLAMPEGFLTTYLLPALAQDNITREWYSTLPQPPVSLPLGYSISTGYFADSVNGKGVPIILIKAKRVGRRNNMPKQYGVNAHVEGSKIILEASDGSSLLGKNLYVTMASTRTTDLDAVLNAPDDIIQNVFTAVTTRILQRNQIPKDILQDDVSQGNKTS